MKEVKTKGPEKGSGSLDRSSDLSERMKRGLIHSKDQIQNLSDDGQVTPDEYAEDRVKNGAEDIAEEAAYDTKEAIRKTYDGNKRLVQQIKEKRRSADTIKQTEKSTGKQTLKTVKKNLKTAGNTTGRTVKTSETTAHTTIKTTEKTAKTAEQTAKAAKKTAEATAKAAKKTAEAAKKAAEATAKAAKAAAKAVVAAVKAVASGIKSLVAAIAAGGWVAVVIILVIVIVALIVGSCFGIFGSMEDSGTGMTMRDAINEINAEYEERIAGIKNSTTYDKLEMNGGRTRWPDVLSVYSVKTTTDSENAQEVATMDAFKFGILEDVFWDMHIITSRTYVRTETEMVETVDKDGNISAIEIEVTNNYLYISVRHKTPEEMANEYGFDNNQRQQLAELLDPKNASQWNKVLYGYSTGNGEIVDVARRQIGNDGGEAYWTWYGFNKRPEWCAIFVSWCANECGYIDDGVIPKFADPNYAVAWFKKRGLWKDRNYVPNPGDIIFFDWGFNGYTDTADHVGIVERVGGEIVYIIEGNSGDAVRERINTIGERDILGYATPQY